MLRPLLPEPGIARPTYSFRHCISGTRKKKRKREEKKKVVGQKMGRNTQVLAKCECKKKKKRKFKPEAGLKSPASM